MSEMFDNIMKAMQQLAEDTSITTDDRILEFELLENEVQATLGDLKEKFFREEMRRKKQEDREEIQAMLLDLKEETR